MVGPSIRARQENDSIRTGTTGEDAEVDNACDSFTVHELPGRYPMRLQRTTVGWIAVALAAGASLLAVAYRTSSGSTSTVEWFHQQKAVELAAPAVPDPADPYHMRPSAVPSSLVQDWIIEVKEGTVVRAIVREYNDGGFLIQEGMIEGDRVVNQNYLFKNTTALSQRSDRLARYRHDELLNLGYQDLGSTGDGREYVKSIPVEPGAAFVRREHRVVLSDAFPGIALIDSDTGYDAAGSAVPVYRETTILIERIEAQPESIFAFKGESPSVPQTGVTDAPGVTRSTTDVGASPVLGSRTAKTASFRSGWVSRDSLPLGSGAFEVFALEGIWSGQLAFDSGFATVAIGEFALFQQALQRTTASWVESVPTRVTLADGSTHDAWIAKDADQSNIGWAFVTVGDLLLVVHSSGITPAEVAAGIEVYR